MLGDLCWFVLMLVPPSILPSPGGAVESYGPPALSVAALVGIWFASARGHIVKDANGTRLAVGLLLFNLLIVVLFIVAVLMFVSYDEPM
ncbi:hypothetical protein G5V59_15765 [Nocardioides sp. W3-2-3]|uniref:hypothetical protein n=1 Tax=Nocardioides convexus TaxID=2712224 RepID=UPI002418A9CA|nr:hypothetical protein [Nocardioides convexus]NHA00885.1 hypothetical protein [Nocardioides convexus]